MPGEKISTDKSSSSASNNQFVLPISISDPEAFREQVDRQRSRVESRQAPHKPIITERLHKLGGQITLPCFESDSSQETT